eukprot:3161320-Rhodomonas_salina.1
MTLALVLGSSRSNALCGQSASIDLSTDRSDAIGLSRSKRRKRSICDSDHLLGMRARVAASSLPGNTYTIPSRTATGNALTHAALKAREKFRVGVLEARQKFSGLTAESGRWPRAAGS